MLIGVEELVRWLYPVRSSSKKVLNLKTLESFQQGSKWHAVQYQCFKKNWSFWSSRGAKSESAKVVDRLICKHLHPSFKIKLFSLGIDNLTIFIFCLVYLPKARRKIYRQWKLLAKCILCRLRKKLLLNYDMEGGEDFLSRLDK